METIEKIIGSLNLIKVDAETWDVIILAEPAALKAFTSVYSNLFYVDKSVFDEKPAVVAPDFSNKLHAETWAEYWRRVFENPNNACKTCPTVKEFIDAVQRERVEEARNE